MYNDVEHDLVALDLPNIVYAFTKGNAKPMKVHAFLQPLLVKVAKARPKWTLVGVDYTYRGSENEYMANAFDVYDHGEKLGVIRKDYTYSGGGGDIYAIDNKRMADKRQRGSATTTKDLAKAFKIITREFHGDTPHEMLTEANMATWNALSHVANHRRSQYQFAITKMSYAMQDFALARWDEFHPTALASGVPKTVIEGFHVTEEAHQMTLALSNAHGEQKTMLVVLRGTDYLVKQNDNITILASDQLTPHMRRCIGMLKLASKGDFIPWVGVKGNDTSFLIMPEPEGEQQ